MRPSVASLVASALLFAAPCLAQSNPGVALRWDHCFGEGTGVTHRSFTCSTNVGTEVLVGSFVLPSDLPSVSGSEITIDFNTAPPNFGPDPFPPPGPPLPEWWKFKEVATCRLTALTASFLGDAANTVCQDWGAGQQVGGIGAYRLEPLVGQGRARLLMAVAVPQNLLVDLSAGTEYSVVTVRINHSKTVGAGACAGCELPMFIAVSSINVVTPVLANNIRLSGPMNGSDADRVTWNAGVTATRASSWAALKARYR